MIPTTLAPFLSVRNGAKAVDFYKSAFGAEELFRHEDPSGAVVSNLSIDGYSFWVSDESPEHKNYSPETLNGGTVRMILSIEDPDAAFDRAVAAGATVVCPIRTEHAWRIGRVLDPFGHHWEIGKPLAKTRPTTQAISPFFIVSNVDQTIAFYRDKLGFEARLREPDRDPFFGIIGRDGAQILIKSDKDVSPLPNHKRHHYMRWDAFVYAHDPDALAAEFTDRGAAFSVPLQDTHDGLRGFEISDPDGYVLFFGRPNPK